MDLAKYEDLLIKALERVDGVEIIKAVNLIREKWMRGSTIYIIGNGGSASIAEHFATDLIKTTEKEPPIKAVSLVNNISLITAISNDYDFYWIFLDQIATLMKQDDLLISFSTSGKSQNILNTVDFCKRNDMDRLSFLGFNGGFIKPVSNFNVLVPWDDVMMIENIFSILCHFITMKLKNNESIYEQPRLF